MDTDVTQMGEVTVVRLLGSRLDAAQSVPFKEALRSVSDTGAHHILLDMSEVEFLDSSGLGAIVTVMKYLGREKRVQLAGLSGAVAKVFRLTRMDTVFRLFPTLDDALADRAA